MQGSCGFGNGPELTLAGRRALGLGEDRCGAPLCEEVGEPEVLRQPNPAQACVLAVASCPGVTDVLIAASSAPHWREEADAVAQPSLAAAKLREITGVPASA